MDKKLKEIIKKNKEELIKLSAELFDDINCKVCGECDRNTHGKTRGCCEYCVEHNGYFRNNEIKNIKDLKKEYNFDNKLGFWDKGCKLPREKRSLTCLYYCCEKLEDEVIKIKGRNKWDEFRQKEIVIREGFSLLVNLQSIKQFIKSNE